MESCGLLFQRFVSRAIEEMRRRFKSLVYGTIWIRAGWNEQISSGNGLEKIWDTDPHPKEHASFEYVQQLAGPSTVSMFDCEPLLGTSYIAITIQQNRIELVEIVSNTLLQINKTLLHIRLQHHPPASTTTS
jgi:beta-xylosidase